jgi:hypothetical protein
MAVIHEKTGQYPQVTIPDVCLLRGSVDAVREAVDSFKKKVGEDYLLNEAQDEIARKIREVKATAIQEHVEERRNGKRNDLESIKPGIDIIIDSTGLAGLIHPARDEEGQEIYLDPPLTIRVGENLWKARLADGEFETVDGDILIKLKAGDRFIRLPDGLVRIQDLKTGVMWQNPTRNVDGASKQQSQTSGK